MEALILGAVAYDPKVVTIWEGFKRYFLEQGLPFDFVLYSNYERQVEGQVAGQVDVAWNSPLAWIEAERAARASGRRAVALAMRDTDRDLTSVIVVRADSPIRTLSGLAGKTIAVGASDSPQATLIPLLHIADSGVAPGKDCEILRHDLLVGNHLAFSREGVFPAGSTRVLAQTAPYDHCNFTVLNDAPQQPVQKFLTLLLAMSYEDPSVRSLLDMEGLKQWLPGRVGGYAQLNRAVDAAGTIDAWLARFR